MSGFVNTSIRFDDGEIINRIIHTGGICSLFSSRAFYDRDKKAIKDLFAEINMESWEAEDFDVVAPYHYGLIVADFMSDIILDMQGYCDVGYLNLGAYYFEDVKNLADFETSEAYQKSYQKPVVDLVLEKRVLKIEYRNIVQNQEISIPIDERLDNFEDIYRFFADLNKERSAKIYYDTRCIIEKIQEEDYSSYMDRLVSINYSLSERDISEFNKLIEEYDDDMESD